MKTFILVVFLVALNSMVWSTPQSFIIKGFEFRVTNFSVDTDGDSLYGCKLYRVDSLGKFQYLLKHTTKEKIGDCNSEVLQLGNFDVTDSTIVFYSFWCTMGDAPASPYGARKQVYVIGEKGTVKLQSSHLYIETTRIEWSENVGIEFLQKEPKTDLEKRQFELYIKKVETEYNADFVFGNQVSLLIQEVKSKLATEIQKETGYWDKNAPFGIRI